MSDNKEQLNRRDFLAKAGLAAAATTALVACQAPAAAPATSSTSSQSPAAAPPQQGESPWAFGNQIDEIRQRGKIVIGSTMRFPPQAYRDPQTNEPAGYDIEVGKMIAEDLEVDLEWADVEFDALLPGLLSGKYDTILVGIANRPSRALSMGFTRGYVPYDQVMLVRADAPEGPWSDYNQAGMRITAQEAATAEFRAREAFPLAEIVPLKVPEVMLEVEAGRADACLIEAYLALPFAATHPSTRVLLDTATGEPQSVAREWGCIPVRPGEHAFQHYLDNWLAWYRDRGNLDSLYQQIVGPTLRGEVTWD